MAPNKVPSPQFEETVYISEVNGAVEVKSNAQVAMNKNSDLVQKLFSYWLLGKTVSPTYLFQTSGTV